MFDFLKRRHDRFHQAPLSDGERRFIDENVPYAKTLNESDRQELEGLTRMFLEEKSFEGCGGLELSDEIKVTIAAQACVLLLHREGEVYPDLTTILVYPHAFHSQTKAREGAVVIEGDETRLGESSDRGVVILAWDHVNRSTRHAAHNVVFHELAHQLDAEDGAMDGAPDLPSRSRYQSWAKVFGHEYGVLGRLVDQGVETDIDAYAARSPAEFFAVVTEMFFERPAGLKKRHPALYDELAAFYKQDPASAAST